MPVFVSRKAPKSPRLASLRVEHVASLMLDHLGLAKCELSVLLCDDRFITELNRQHRKKNKPTDVLAFPLHDGPPARKKPIALGDIAISLDTASRQAKERHYSLFAEVTFLLAHGLLHLIGYDHRTTKEEIAMNAKTNELVTLVGAKLRPEPKQRRKVS